MLGVCLRVLLTSSHLISLPFPCAFDFSLQDLQKDGYNVGQLPMSEEALIKSVLTQVGG